MSRFSEHSEVLFSAIRRRTFAAAALSFAVFIIPSAGAEPVRATDVRACEAVFSPAESGFAAIGRLLEGAQKSVFVSAYHFKSLDVADMLIAAARRGVRVAVVLDVKNLDSKKHRADYAARNGIEVYVDGRHHSHHSKYMVVDGRFVQTGSFNYNDHAEHDNAENLLVLESPTLAAAYLKDWEKHREHAVSYLKMSEQSEK